MGNYISLPLRPAAVQISLRCKHCMILHADGLRAIAQMPVRPLRTLSFDGSLSDTIHATTQVEPMQALVVDKASDDKAGHVCRPYGVLGRNDVGSLVIRSRRYRLRTVLTKQEMTSWRSIQYSIVHQNHCRCCSSVDFSGTYCTCQSPQVLPVRVKCDGCCAKDDRLLSSEGRVKPGTWSSMHECLRHERHSTSNDQTQQCRTLH
jgi:hypothetical protein